MRKHLFIRTAIHPYLECEDVGLAVVNKSGAIGTIKGTAKVFSHNLEETLNVYGNRHTELYKDVIDAIRMHCAPSVTAEARCRAFELVLEIYQSATQVRLV